MSVMTEVVVNYELFHNATRYLGSAEIELPDLEFQTADVSGAGIAGSFEAPVQGHTQSLELKIKWRTLTTRPLELMRHGAISLQARAAVQNYDTTGGDVAIRPLKIDMKGRTKGATLGSLKPAEQMENETTLELSYIKITYNNKTTVEIDKMNYIYKVNGWDYLKDVRSALGLAS